MNTLESNPVFSGLLHEYYDRHQFDAPEDVVLREVITVEHGDLRRYTFEHVDRRTITVYLPQKAIASDYDDVSNFLATWAILSEQPASFCEGLLQWLDFDE